MYLYGKEISLVSLSKLLRGQRIFIFRKIKKNDSNFNSCSPLNVYEFYKGILSSKSGSLVVAKNTIGRFHYLHVAMV